MAQSPNVAMNQRVKTILLELMRERHSLYADFTDLELKSLLKSHSGDVSACHATIQGLQASGDDSTGVAELYRRKHGALASGDGADLGAGEREESSSVREAPAAPEGLGRGARNAGQVRSYGSGASKRDAAASGSPRDGHGAPEDGSPKKKRHRPSRDRARERIEKRMPLTRAGVDALDWNEACEYAKSMGVSQGRKRGLQ